MSGSLLFCAQSLRKILYGVCLKIPVLLKRQPFIYKNYTIYKGTITNFAEQKNSDSFSNSFTRSLFKLVTFVWVKFVSIPYSSNNSFKHLRLWCRRKVRFFWWCLYLMFDFSRSDSLTGIYFCFLCYYDFYLIFQCDWWDVCISRPLARCLGSGPRSGTQPWPPICIYRPWPPILFTGPGPQFVFNGPDPQFVSTSPSP